MKKILLIISGVLFTLVLGVWVYLFVFGAPEGSGDIFANFGIGGEPRFTEEGQTSTFVDTAPSNLDGEAQTLRQLTTTPVAGAAFALNDTEIRYAERGTGYMFGIDLSTGRETQLSGTTHTKVIDAEFAASGNTVLFTTETPSGLEVSVETLQKNDTGETRLTTLISAPEIRNAIFSSDGTRIFYTSPAPDGSEMYSYNIDSGADTLLTTIPFRSAVISWGEVNYVYPRPAASLPGHVYRIAGETLQHLRNSGLGLTAFGYDGGFVTTEVTEGGVVSYAFEDRAYQLPLVLFPDKCTDAPYATSTLVCAAPYATPTGSYPDDWYKGVVSLEDAIWEVDVRGSEATLLTDPLAEVGRAIDVKDIVSNSDGSQYLLINKNDDTLWLFEPGV